MAVFRSLGARPDDVRGTTAAEVRKFLAGLVTGPGVLPGSASVLVQGLSSFSYRVNAGLWATSRGSGDGVHVWGNDGPMNVATDPAPASGLSRVDIVYAWHPSAGENGNESSAPVVGVARGAPASLPVAPALPVGALELARNTMASGATSTNSSGNSLAQSAPRAFWGQWDEAVASPYSTEAGWTKGGALRRRGGWAHLSVDWQRTGNPFSGSDLTLTAALPSGYAPTDTVYGVLLNQNTREVFIIEVASHGPVRAIGVSMNTNHRLRGSVRWPLAGS